MVFPNEVVALPDPAVASDLVDGPTFKDKLVAQLGPYKPVVEALQAHGLTLPTRTLVKTAAYTMVPGDGTVLADATTGAFDVTLPGHLTGRMVRVVKVDDSANAVTVLPGSGLLAGGASDVLGAQWLGATYQSDGANWLVVARAAPPGTFVGVAGTETITGAKTFERPAADGDTADGVVFTFGGQRRVAVRQQATTDLAPGAGIVEITDGTGGDVGPGSWLRMTYYQYGASFRGGGPKGSTVEMFLGEAGSPYAPTLSVRHNGSNLGAFIQARDPGDFAGVGPDFQTAARPRLRVEVSASLPNATVLGIENGNAAGKIAFATDSGSGLTDRVLVLNDGKVQVGPSVPNQLVGISGAGAGVSLQDTGVSGRSWELISGSAAPGTFSIFDRSVGHRLTIGPTGLVSIAAGGLALAAGDLNVAAGSANFSYELHSRLGSAYQVSFGAVAAANQAAVAFGPAGDAKLYRTGPTVLVTDSDLEHLIGKGPMVHSPDGTRYRIIVANGGALSAVAA